LATRPYSEKIHEVIGHLAAQPQEDPERLHPLLQRRPVKRIEVVHITPNRGLAGGMPSAMNRATAQFILRQRVPVSIIAVGRKGRDFMVRYGRDVRAVFTDLSDRPSLLDTLPISRLAIQDYTSGQADEVYLAYSQFVSTMVQRPVVTRLLPIEPPPGSAEHIEKVGYIFEPSNIQVLGALLPRFVEMQVYHAVLENIASEQSARMVAMRNATENAKEMVEELTLTMNKIRQETITKELLDIVGAVAGLQR